MQVHAYCVCDDPEYFYEYVQGLLDGLQAGVISRDIVDIQNVSFIFIILLDFCLIQRQAARSNMGYFSDID